MLPVAFHRISMPWSTALTIAWLCGCGCVNRSRRRTLLFCAGVLPTALKNQQARRRVAKLFAAGVMVTDRRTNGNPTGYTPPKPVKVRRAFAWRRRASVVQKSVKHDPPGVATTACQGEEGKEG